MYERFNTYSAERPKLRKVVGWLLVVFGFIALVTPLTPGGLLFFVGLELLGLRFIFTEKVKRVLVRPKKVVPQEETIFEVPQERTS